jgi:endogenous inhibitor of DNA gyrase (YacG/DUF329 family)
MSRVRCPICDRAMDHQGPKEWPDWPFCSPRCKLVDLGRWLGEEYRVPTPQKEEHPEDTDVPGPPQSADPPAAFDREEA